MNLIMQLKYTGRCAFCGRMEDNLQAVQFNGERMPACKSCRRRKPKKFYFETLSEKQAKYCRINRDTEEIIDYSTEGFKW